MSIQIINYDGINIYPDNIDATYATFQRPYSLDSFDINILDFNDLRIWKNDKDDLKSIILEKDIINLQKMISQANKTKMIILLPQDLNYSYSVYHGHFPKTEELKNTLSTLSHVINLLTRLNLDIIYENTCTLINNSNHKAAFYFKDTAYNIITSSNISNKTTTIKYKFIFLTFLEFKNYVELMFFLNEVGIIVEKNKIPDWVCSIKMFDDIQQLKVVDENLKIIQSLKDSIDDAQKKIEENNKYKSILYTNGNELVEVVFEILTEITGCNLNEFIDKKKEDFSFVVNGITCIGEIKGISSNVKSQNISQLEFHHQGFLDDNPEVEDINIRQLLIINHQRNVPLEKRDPVDSKQIQLAQKYGSLIVETRMLLKLLEDYRVGKLTQNKCFEILTKTTGILEYK